MKYRPTGNRKWANYRRERRIVQEYGLEESRDLCLISSLNNSKSKKKQKKKGKIKKRSEPVVGEHYEEKLKQFLYDGGNLKDCPF